MCLLIADVLCLRARSADDLERADDDDYDARHVRHLTGSSFTTTGSDVKKMAADMAAHETVYLRLNGMHPYRGCTGSYLSDTSTTGVSVTR